MKQKRCAADSTALTPSASELPVDRGSLSDTVQVCIFSVLLFAAMTVQTEQMTLLLAAGAFALSIGKGPLKNIRERLGVPILGLMLFALMNGLAAIYAPFGDYAVGEFYKIFAALSLASIVWLRAKPGQVRGILWGIAAVCGSISLLCIDGASKGELFRMFSSLVEPLGAAFTSIDQNTWGMRVAGIYNDANVSGSILGLGTLVSLYLAHTGRSWKETLPACWFTGLSAMGFFLSMSRGAILMFALALLVWLLAEGKGRRLPLFFFMLVSAAVTVAASIPAVSAVGTDSLLADGLALTAGLVMFVLHWAVTARAARLLEGHVKAMFVVVMMLLAACGIYAAAAFRFTGPAVLTSSGYLSRVVSLSPGTYTVEGDWDAGLTFRVGYRTSEDALLGNTESLYDGSMEEASFTVPQGDGQTILSFSGRPGTALRRVELSNGTEIPLGYPLLPDFVINRLQGGLTGDSSFLLRVQYMKDAWTIFLRSPLLGHGLGSTEGLYTAVQPFYYESLYVHNHLLQVMCDMGLLGLAGFLTFLLGVAWLLLRRVREGQDSLAAVLLACWVMMNGHSLMEINFSVRAYQCIAFLLLLLPVVLYTKPLSEKAVKWGALAVGGFFWLYLLVFGSLLESHRMVRRDAEELSTGDARAFLDAMVDYTRRDVFDHEQYQLTFVGNTVLLNDSRYNGYLRKYVEELRASGTYTACSGLARYYYLPKGDFEELFACSREGIAQEASTNAAWNLQVEFYRTEVLPAAGEQMEVFLDGVLALKDYLAEQNQGRLQAIVLTEENQAFLNAVDAVRAQGMSEDAAFIYLTQVHGFTQAENTETP